jgi:hypothetical protein
MTPQIGTMMIVMAIQRGRTRCRRKGESTQYRMKGRREKYTSNRTAVFSYEVFCIMCYPTIIIKYISLF